MSAPAPRPSRLRGWLRLGRFASVATAGVAFQGGSAAVDSATIMAALVFQLTGSTIAVGAVTAILRFGWLFPQLFVGYFAQRAGSSMRYYAIGAFGRATCLAALGVVLVLGAGLPPRTLATFVLALWTAYAFISGIVAVPYNDIVARSVPSERRSRVMALRFFGGGVLALGVAAAAEGLVGRLPFPASYAAVVAMAAALMLVSSTVFVAMGEPEGHARAEPQTRFRDYLREGVAVFRTDRTFRGFVYAQWCGAVVLMALPLYVVDASARGFDLRHVALLLAAQTAGALASNALWGWWGDYRGKGSLLRGIALARVLPPLAVLALAPISKLFGASWLLPAYLAVFFVLGGLANGLTIAVIGYLMEISPDGRRPAYSGYFNALTAPAFLLPLFGGMLAALVGLAAVFALSGAAAAAQYAILQRLGARRPVPV